jgi:cysteine desulfurase/selenocysteine lyase
MIDTSKIRQDFPILQTKVEGKPLVYLDNAATTHKPWSVIKALEEFYSKNNANVHRSVHGLANEATAGFERARVRTAGFIGASCPRCEIFTRNTTESINLVAQAWGKANLKKGDEVLVTEMEHHANLVPWQVICRETGAALRWIPLKDDGRLDLSTLDTLLNKKTKMFAFTWVSNVLGTINPVKDLVARAKAVGALTLVDGAQAVPHLPCSVRELGCDFLAFSGHKMLGPTGVGVLWGREDLMEAMPPYQTGGSMIDNVTMEATTYNQIPWRFEAGTPDIAAVVAFDSALTYLQKITMKEVRAHEQKLVTRALEGLSKIEGFKLYGPENPADRSGVVSFNLKGVMCEDVGPLLDSMGLAIRTGKLCAHPIMNRFKTDGMVRASFYIYNTEEEVDILVESLKRVKKILTKK